MVFSAASFCEMYEAGISSDAMVMLGEEIFRHKSGEREKAIAFVTRQS
jgi:hypothetical protein